jgi:hypothetical protein
LSITSFIFKILGGFLGSSQPSGYSKEDLDAVDSLLAQEDNTNARAMIGNR